MSFVSLAGYSFKIAKFMIFITFTKIYFNNKKSRRIHPKIVMQTFANGIRLAVDILAKSTLRKGNFQIEKNISFKLFI